MISLALLTVLGAGSSEALEAQVHELTLKNGMTWLIVERHEAPVFTGYIRIRVGGADERPGQTGLAHLFEHMAFKGTPVLGTSDWQKEQPLLQQIREKGDAVSEALRADDADPQKVDTLKKELKVLTAEHKKLTDENALARLYLVNGGVGLNATTNKDLTSYFVSMPANRLRLWLQVEASRLAAPVLRDFFTERDVVSEERSAGIDSNPAGMMYEEMNHTAFVTSPYRWPVVGYSKDLGALRMSEAEQFWQEHYAPANAVGCIVGDVDFEKLKVQLEETFGSIPARPRPPEARFSEPVSRSQRRSTVFYDAAPRLLMAFRKPKAPSKADDVADVLQTLLGEGRTGRLDQRLVFQDKLAQSVSVSTGPGTRLDNLFIISVTPLAGVKLETVEQALWSELKRLSTEPVSDQELQKVRNRLEADTARSLDDSRGIADALSSAQALYGDWRYATQLPARIRNVTADDVASTAKAFFTVTNSVVVTLQRPESGGAR